MDVFGNRGVIGKNIIVFDLVIVGYMGICYEKIIVVDLSDIFVLNGILVNGVVFLDLVIIFDF